MGGRLFAFSFLRAVIFLYLEAPATPYSLLSLCSAIRIVFADVVTAAMVKPLPVLEYLCEVLRLRAPPPQLTDSQFLQVWPSLRPCAAGKRSVMPACVIPPSMESRNIRCVCVCTDYTQTGLYTHSSQLTDEQQSLSTLCLCVYRPAVCCPLYSACFA